MEARSEVSRAHRRSELTQGPVSTLSERRLDNRLREHTHAFEDADACNSKLEPASAIRQKNVVHAIGRI